MKKIEAVIKPFKLDAVKEALENEKVQRITVVDVKGVGRRQGQLKYYRGARYIEAAAELKVEVVAEDDEAQKVTDKIVTALRTGDLCDGEVTILPIETVVRVRIDKCS
jgi:nitrogen regulatory protein P-II 1